MTFTASSAGALTGQVIHVENNFDNVAGSDIALSGAAYRLAGASVTPTSVNFGIIHVGDTVSQNISLSNNAAADGFSESLNATYSSGSSGVNASGSILNLAAGATDTSSLSVSVDTSGAGIVSGSSLIALESDGTGSSGLGIADIADVSIAVNAQINNFASPEYAFLSGPAAFSGSGTSYTLNFGTVAQGGPDPTAGLAILNNIAGPADTLAGSFTDTGASGFTLMNFTSFSGVDAGDSQGGLTITLDTSTAGMFSETIFFDPRSRNASGFDGALDRITLTVTGQVMIPEPSSTVFVILAATLGLTRRTRRA